MEYEIETPLTKEKISKFNVGDMLYLTGTVITVRDKAHEKAIEMHRNGKELPVNFSEGAIFHCGPIMRKKDKWEVIAAGPTTSSRMESFEHEFIKRFSTKIIIGKGGMGIMTAEACKKYGAVYCVFTGGVAVLAAKAVSHVKDVFWLDELGMPEALWVFAVKRFGPLTVTIDIHGNNLTEKIKKRAKEKARAVEF
ncbi:MAG: FumA C-terminus/TtdB family hydratase beta subunit [Candidatus Thermoplasmatota archaeon]|nr:FumA C-terminus/TtdB family hydratase beta subunit [Candidatus Thermoplasmatota archaeon]